MSMGIAMYVLLIGMVQKYGLGYISFTIKLASTRIIEHLQLVHFSNIIAKGNPPIKCPKGMEFSVSYMLDCSYSEEFG